MTLKKSVALLCGSLVLLDLSWKMPSSDGIGPIVIRPNLNYFDSELLKASRNETQPKH